MNPNLIDSIGWTLLHFVWQGALIGCATALALTALRNAAPGQRYAVACTSLAACLLWPAFDLALRLQAGDGAAAHLRFADSLVRQADFAAGQGLPAWLQAQMMWIVAFWTLCTLVLASRMALGLLWIRRAASAPAAGAQWQQRVACMAGQFGVTRPVALRVVDDLDSPLTAGWWRPVILVPVSLMSAMPPDLLEALLAHEMAHVRRFDYLVNLGQNVIEILLFYHPAVWWISRRIRVEREQIADDLAAKHLGEPRRLARALSELERWQFSSHHLALGANGGDLLSRVKRLVRPDREALNWKASLPVLGLALAVLSLYAHASSPDAPPQVARIEAAAATELNRTAAVADFKTCKKPLWPRASLRAGHTGTVTLNFQIDEAGWVVDSKLIGSSGDPLLDDAARVGIEKCRFKPGTVDGRNVVSWMRMQYVWLLK